MEDANIFILPYILASVPRRLIHDHNNPVFLKVLGAFREEYFHCIGVGIGENERKGFAVMGTYGTEYMGVFPYDVSRHHRSYPFWSPAMNRLRYSSKSAFVLEQELHRPCILFDEPFLGGCHQFRKFFLNSSCFSVSAFGC